MDGTITHPHGSTPTLDSLQRLASIGSLDIVIDPNKDGTSSVISPRSHEEDEVLTRLEASSFVSRCFSAPPLTEKPTSCFQRGQ